MSINSKRVNEVFETKDYSKFKFRDDNRPINPAHVKSIMKNMRKRGWIPGSYIVVNRLFEIIDGQHRTKSAIALNLPIKYVVEKEADGEEMYNLNKDQRNWQMINHIPKFIKEGNENYTHLKEFMDKFPHFKPTEAMMFCKNQFTRVSRGSFEEGDFVVKDMKKAYQWATDVTSLKDYFSKYYNKSLFVRAIIVCFNKPKFKFKEFYHKVKLRPMSLVPCGTVEQYIEMIEIVYNYRRNVNEKVNLRY